MKIPQYMFKRPIHIGHPLSTIESVAKALEIEAALHRQEKNREAAWAIGEAAKAFRRMVSQNLTWAQAFDWGPAASHAAGEESK